MANGHSEDWKVVEGKLVEIQPPYHVREGEVLGGKTLVSPKRFAAEVVINDERNGVRYSGIIWDVVAKNYLDRQVQLKEKINGTPGTFDFAAPGEQPYNVLRPVTLVQRLYCDGNVAFEALVELVRTKK